MENFDYFDALKESLEQAVDYTKGDKSRCRTVVRETPIPAYKADDVARTRKELKLSQRGLATALGVSPRTVESWEAGKMHRLVLHNGCSICLNVITRWWSAWWLAEIEFLSTGYDIALTAISCTLKVAQ